jgi:hypothetical protein
VAGLTVSDPIPAMEELVQRYLEHRRQFGYRLFSQGYALLAFARFADQTFNRPEQNQLHKESGLKVKTPYSSGLHGLTIAAPLAFRRKRNV